MSLNTIEQDNILEIVARQEKRIAQLEAMLNGQSIRTARIADASITNIKIKDASITDAKIVSLSADKITAGEIIVAVDIGSPSSGYIRLDGDNNRIIVNDGTNNRILIGEV
jgi:hypothetical protein